MARAASLSSDSVKQNNFRADAEATECVTDVATDSEAYRVMTFGIFGAYRQSSTFPTQKPENFTAHHRGHTNPVILFWMPIAVAEHSRVR